MKMSDTPRTDGQERWILTDGGRYSVVGAHFARDIERELAATNERIRRLERSLDLCDPRFSRFCRTVSQAESAPEGGGQSMSDTPRTNLNHLTVETLRTMKGTGTKIVLASVSSRLERELAAANERIRRLEAAGNAMSHEMQFGEWQQGSPRAQANAARDSWRAEMGGRV